MQRLTWYFVPFGMILPHDIFPAGFIGSPRINLLEAEMRAAEAKAASAGFSSGEPWLPVSPQHGPRAADVQQLCGDSVLMRTRRFLQWRKAQPLLIHGAIRLHDAPDSCVLLSRSDGDRVLVGAFNLSAARVELPCPFAAASLEGHGMAGTLAGAVIVLPPYEAWFGAAI